MNKIKIFLATPISGLKNHDYSAYRDVLLHLVERLKEKYEVYSELEHISDIKCYDSPEKSVIEDFRRINEADIFLLHHPARVQSSTLIELGYACAQEKEIIIVGNKTDLPYLALGLPASPLNTIIIETLELDADTIEKIFQTIDFLILRRNSE